MVSLYHKHFKSNDFAYPESANHYEPRKLRENRALFILFTPISYKSTPAISQGLWSTLFIVIFMP